MCHFQAFWVGSKKSEIIGKKSDNGNFGGDIFSISDISAEILEILFPAYNMLFDEFIIINSIQY